MLAEGREFSISHDPASHDPAGGDPVAGPGGETGDESWLELLANGLTFDLCGLVPGAGYTPAQFRHRFGLPDSFEPRACKALALLPGPHLAGGAAMLPVIRTQLWLATLLCTLTGIVAVGWAPARSISSVEHFVGSARRWLEGGVFPSLGLTALTEIHDGALHSEGLAFFTGQELRIEPELAADKAAAARLALRLINELVGRGKVTQPERIVGPQGEALRIAPSGNGRFVRVWPDR